MADQWIVRLIDQRQPYGPFDDLPTAQAFAAYLADEVDPATVERLRSPLDEILSWRSADVAANNRRKALDLHREKHRGGFGDCALDPCRAFGPLDRAYQEQEAGR